MQPFDICIASYFFPAEAAGEGRKEIAAWIDGLVISAKIQPWLQPLRMNGCSCREEQGGSRCFASCISARIHSFCHLPETAATPSSRAQPPRCTQTACWGPSTPFRPPRSRQQPGIQSKALVSWRKALVSWRNAEQSGASIAGARAPAMRPPPGCSTSAGRGAENCIAAPPPRAREFVETGE